MSDKKTTTAGAGAALGTLLIGIGFMIDGDPETMIDMQATVAAAGVVIAAVSLFLKGFWSKDK